MKESEFSALSTDEPNNASGSEPVEENKEIVEDCIAGDINMVVEKVNRQKTYNQSGKLC